jgi:uncharacterized membrane protein YqjE
MVASDLGATLSNVSRIGSSADLLLRAIDNRAALAALELAEAKRRLTMLAIWSVIGALALLLGGITITWIVAAIFWDTPQRVTALVVLALLQFVVVVASGWFVHSRWHRWSLFEDSREQFAKDVACLREIVSQNQS